MKIPENKRETLDRIVCDLKSIDGVAALALGGSYCTGMAHADSDLDIGIYYLEASPFDIEALRTAAAKHHTDGSLTVTGFYQWGAWVNGGAWIHTASGEVDLLYKNTDQIRATIEKAKDGIFENDFEQQPPYGFSSIIYLAETHYCIPLWDPHKILEGLKAEVRTYPQKLKQAVIQQSLWAAEFTLWQADKFAEKADPYNTAGCHTRALKKIVDALFAINELYPMGDKNAITILEKAAKRPERFREEIESILSIDKSRLVPKTKEIRTLFDQTVSLAGGAYSPYFEL